MYHHVLVVETDNLLQFVERKLRIFGNDPIVETMKQTLKLGNDHVLVVARIADQSTTGRTA